MPALSTETKAFIQRVKDDLTLGQDRGARATAVIGSDADGTVTLSLDGVGDSGNSYTVEVTVPGGTTALTASILGTDITVALDVTAGSPTASANTATLIAAEITSSIAGVSATASGDGTTEITSAEGPTAFSGGEARDVLSPATPINYVRAQDTATVLDLFTGALFQLVTATGGSTNTATVTSIADGAYVGGTVTFGPATTTAALRDVSAEIVSVVSNTITLSGELPAAVVNTDDFFILPASSYSATALRGGNPDWAAAPSANVYGDRRELMSALILLSEQFGAGISNKQLSHASLETGVGSTESEIIANQELRVDEFKGLIAAVSGTARTVVANNDTTIFLNKDLGSAPADGVQIIIRSNKKNMNPQPFSLAHPATQPGDNYDLADIIAQVEGEVEAFTLPS